MLFPTGISLLLASLAAGPAVESSTLDLAALLPAQVEGWKAAPPDEHATYETLFSLIDGGAEVYRSLNVRRVISRKYVKPDGADLIADVYDMGSAEDAYGAFHFDVRERTSAQIGQESEWERPNLFFWKDRYFVSVAAIAVSPAAENAALALGKAIAASIPRVGAVPELVINLPKDGLVQGQIHYFHDWPLLSRHYAPVDENVLALNKTTRGVLARYRDADGQAMTTVLQIRYASPDAATRALAAYRKKVMPGAADQGPYKSRDGRWSGARAHGDRVVIVIDAPTEKETLRRMTQLSPPATGKERP